MTPNITLSGIEEVISNLNYKNPKTYKFKLLQYIKNKFDSEESVKAVTYIDPDEIIKNVWETDDAPESIRSKRRNLSSVKSAINTDLKKLYEKELNPEGIIIGTANVFEMSEEVKNKLLDSFTNSIKTEGDVDLNKISDVLNAISNFLSDVDQEQKDTDSKSVIDKIKTILNNLSGKIFDEDEGSGTEDGDIELEGADELEEIEFDDDEDIEDVEIDNDEEIQEIGYDDEDSEIEEFEVDEDTEEIELDEDEDIEEIELDEDEDIEEIELDEDEDIEEIELDEDEDIEEIELDEDEDIEEIELDEDEDIEEIELDEDEDIEEIELDEDEDIEEIELDEDEDIEEIELDEDEDIEEIELDEDEDIEEIELDEDEDIEEIELDEDEDIEEIELDEDEDIEEIELDEDEDIEEIELDEDEDIEEIELDEDEDIEEIELDEDEDIEEIELDEDEDIEEIELDEDEDIEEIELDEDEDIEEIELDEDEDIEEIELDEDEDIEEIELDEDEDIEEISLDEDEELEVVEGGLSFDDNDGEFRLDDEEGAEENKRLSEQFESYLGAMEKFYNQYLIVPGGKYIVGAPKPSGIELAEQTFFTPDVYMGKFQITNVLFEIFIEKTGYITTAEKLGYGTVYHGKYAKQKDPKTGVIKSVWKSSHKEEIVKGACWYQPFGPGSNLHNKKGHPVVQVSVEDASSFSAWIGKRLPSEFEWEAAARTMKGNYFPWGNEWDSLKCNNEKSGFSDTTPVNEFIDHENELGIADTLGNVMEWTIDEYSPPRPDTKKQKWAIAKGGSYISDHFVKLYSRFFFKKNFTSNIIGFRCMAE